MPVSQDWVVAQSVTAQWGAMGNDLAPAIHAEDAVSNATLRSPLANDVAKRGYNVRGMRRREV